MTDRASVGSWGPTKDRDAVGLTLAAIRDLLGCAVLAGAERLGVEVSTIIATDAMSVVLAAPQPGALMITGLANIQSVRTANVAALAAILYVRGIRPNDKAIELAREKKIVLLATAAGMFDACGILRNEGLKGAI
jgi:predicted transcriptional regulator